MGFKENLKAELEYQGLQLKELSAKCGISRNTLGNYLTGHNSIPSADTAVRIARALDVTVEYLVTGKEFSRSLPRISPIRYRKIFEEITRLDDIDLEAVGALVTTLRKRYG